MLPHGWVNKDEIYGPVAKLAHATASSTVVERHVGSNPTRATTNGVMNRWHISTPFKIYVLSMTIKGLIYERGVIDSTSDFDSLSSSLSLDVRANAGLAQLVEQLFCKQKVVSSRLTSSTI